MVKFICYPKCSTCKKAQSFLDENNIKYEIRDIKTDNPTYEEIKALYEKSGLPLKKFFNTSGLIYRSMNLKDKLPDMSEDEQLRLLATDGMLVKRPIAVSDSNVLVGFNAEKWSVLK
jgi:arsenate reductase